MEKLIRNAQREVLLENLAKKEDGKELKTEVLFDYLDGELAEELEGKGYVLSKAKDGFLLIS